MIQLSLRSAAVVILLSGCSVLHRTPPEPINTAELPIASDSVADSLLVDVQKVDTSIVVEMRYATTNNFTKAKLPGYEGNHAYLRDEAAAALDDIVLDINRLSVAWKNSVVALTVTEFWMVHALVKFPGHVKSRDQLMREAELTVDDNTITSHMKRIRKKFIVVDPIFDSIETVYGMGYRWQVT